MKMSKMEGMAILVAAMVSTFGAVVPTPTKSTTKANVYLPSVAMDEDMALTLTRQEFGPHLATFTPTQETISLPSPAHTPHQTSFPLPSRCPPRWQIT